MDSNIKESLIAIMSSSEGGDILNSIASSCQKINDSNGADKSIDKFKKFSALFYGEIYDMYIAFKHMMEVAGVTPTQTISTYLEILSQLTDQDNVINHTRNTVSEIYEQKGEAVPADTPLIDILNGFHHERTVVNRYRLLKMHGFSGHGSNEQKHEYLSFYGRLNGIAKVYVGDKKSLEINLNSLHSGDVKTTPFIALSWRDLTIYSQAKYENFEYGSNNYSATKIFTDNRFPVRELTDNATTIIPECLYVASRSNYTTSDQTIPIDQSILDKGNIRWLYIGIDDATYSKTEAGLEGLLDVTITSVYDNYCMRTV